MYVNQIDSIIDQILDKLYLEGLSNDQTFNLIINEKKINYVEYRDEINQFISDFTNSIDVAEIKTLINNKENLIRILDIIKRYVAYYCFLTIAYYYTGDIKSFRNNLIQYSKLQESSNLSIKNFFDTENNYQIIQFFKIIKDVTKIILMTDLQKKTLNQLDVKDAIAFLNDLGLDYIDKYLLTVTAGPNGSEVSINVHNLIKTIVFREIYRNQEQNIVFGILNDIEEADTEYTYIDIVVANEDVADYESFRQIFLGAKNAQTLSRDLFELVTESTKIQPVLSADLKNDHLFQYGLIVPIVDDFLRYHRDSERLDLEPDRANVFITNNNEKNVKLALLYQQRKKKENTKAQLIVNKIEAVSDFYSDSIKSKPEALKEVQKFFQGPFMYRKAITYNYVEEVYVLNKIINQGKKAIDSNEYYLELKQAISTPYYNFKDFKNYGTTINLQSDSTINMLRYSNIEFKSLMEKLEVDVRTGTTENVIDTVGIAIGPFNGLPLQCTPKSNLVDIRQVKISYMKGGKLEERKTDNGYKAFLYCLKYFFIETIAVKFDPKPILYNDFSNVKKLNVEIYNSVIYWIYDVEKDYFEMDTYENLKSLQFQETIKFMNAVIHDKMTQYLHRKLRKLIAENIALPLTDIYAIIEKFNRVYKLALTEDEKRKIIIVEYLRKKTLLDTLIIDNFEQLEMPEFVHHPSKSAYKIKIDFTNPIDPQPYVKLKLIIADNSESQINDNNKCVHETEWNKTVVIKSEGLKNYNIAITQFIDKFAIETAQLDFVCKICGQVLPMKQYVQDGSYDNITQRFVTSYVPLDTALEDTLEYGKYGLTIKYLDALINRISLITGTNMLVGPNNPIKQKRKSLVKNIIDIILKHNSVNMVSGQTDEARLEYFNKKFNVDKDLDNVFFFELDNSIFNFDPSALSIENDANKLKYNNILLYFVLVFITELNGAQISMMSNDKYANIYIYLTYGQKLFGNLLIKKNINDMDTAPITEYPVLCYLLFLITYYMIKYKLWYSPANNTKTFNPYYQKIIINSFVDMFNSISIDSGRYRDDHTYSLISNKLYASLNSTFKNNEIVQLLKANHARYNKINPETIAMVEKPKIEILSIADPIQIHLDTIVIPTYKISSGILFDTDSKIRYNETITMTNITNCLNGHYHDWKISGSSVVCEICGEKTIATTDLSVLDSSYYNNLNYIANKRCLQGTQHDFTEKNGELICTICHKKKNIIYTTDELDLLESNMNKLQDANTMQIFDIINIQNVEQTEYDNMAETVMQNLISSYLKNSNNADYGQSEKLIDRFVDLLESYIGINANLDVDKHPVYLKDNVYIIDHQFNGIHLPTPIILLQKDNRIHFKEAQPFFKTDVYYYTDNRSQTDVFYDAITLKLIGYKEKHKDYIRLNNIDSYLQINYSIKNKLLMMGYETKYIDITNNFIKNSKTIKDVNENYFQILDNLIKEHIIRIKNIIDKFGLFVYKILNYIQITDTEVEELQSDATIEIEKLVRKYNTLIRDLKTAHAFETWNSIRNMVNFKEVDWIKTNIRPNPTTTNMFLNCDVVNYYDLSSNYMIYYLISQFTIIMDANSERITKVSISQMYIDIINYIYNLYNIDRYKNSMELKRFSQILNGSEYMIDLLKRGQGLQRSRKLELLDIDIEPEPSTEQLDEMEDLKEEAEALDIDGDYFAEEDEDNAQFDENET